MNLMNNLFTYDIFLLEKKAKKEHRPFYGSLTRAERNEFIKKLQNDNQELITQNDKIKNESYKQLELLQHKLSRSSENVFSQTQINEFFSEHLYMLYLKEYSINYSDLIDKTILNFHKYSP